MKILLDHNLPRKIGRFLSGFEVLTTYRMGWAERRNGVLLRTAAEQGIGALLTVDKKMEFEQNLRTLPSPIIHLDALSNALPGLMPFLPHVVESVKTPLVSALYVVSFDGALERLVEPRR